MDKVAKTVKVGNLSFSLKVLPDQIQLYENAEKRANNLLNGCRERYAKASLENQLSMVILELALDLELTLDNNRKNEQKASEIADSVADFMASIGKKEQ